MEKTPENNFTDTSITRELSAWKSEFPILDRYTYVANCSQGPQSRRVADAINSYLESWDHRGMDWELWLDEVRKAKAVFARLINADPGDIAVSTSASAAASSIASALDPDSNRNKIMSTEAEFPTVSLVWQAHRKYGFEVDYIPLHNGSINLDHYEKYVDDQTVLTSATHVYYVNGFKQDLEAIADRVHSRGSLLLVDAYQSLGSFRVDVKKADIDILISGNLKYLLGIPGIAFLYVNKRVANRLKPAQTGWFGQQDPFSFEGKSLDYADGTRRFETGTPPIFAAYAARAGMEIIDEVGLPAIEKQIGKLSKHAIQRAKELKLPYAGPRDFEQKGATTAFRVNDPARLENELRKRNIIASARGDVIRIAPHFFTTREELDRVLEEIRDITC